MARYAELVRYGLVAHDDGSDRMEPVANGQWVRADEAAAAITALEAAVEQAFRDGLTYATNCVVTDPDEAWRTSRARAAIESKP